MKKIYNSIAQFKNCILMQFFILAFFWIMYPNNQLRAQNDSICCIYQLFKNNVDTNLVITQIFDGNNKIIREKYTNYHVDAVTLLVNSTIDYTYKNNILIKKVEKRNNGDSIVENYFYKKDTIIDYIEQRKYNEDDEYLVKNNKDINLIRIQYFYNENILNKIIEKNYLNKVVRSSEYSFTDTSYICVKTNYEMKRKSVFYQMTYNVKLNKEKKDAKILIEDRKKRCVMDIEIFYDGKGNILLKDYNDCLFNKKWVLLFKYSW